ncbi:hypothetical protein ABEB36_005830 [Hypothenemus hampei]|uniref:Odorant receptor n=1 Tax=Hypothenemus hampei TaxID=57062 RepID=A0ABD1F2M5_HYPHA
MGFENLIKIPKFQLEMLALWPKKMSPMYWFRSVLTYFGVFILTASQLYNSALLYSNFVKFSESLYILISLLNGFEKIVVLALKKRTLLGIIEKLNTTQFTKHEKFHRDLIAEVEKIINLMQWVFSIMATLCLVPTVVSPIFDSKSFPLEFPHFHDNPYYIPFYLFQVWSLILCTYSNTPVDELYVGITAALLTQLRMLNNRLKNTKKNIQEMKFYSQESRDKFIVVYLTECCNHYIEIEKLLRDTQDVFSIIAFTQLGITIFATCNTGLTLLHGNVNQSQTVANIFYVLTLFVESGLYCGFGHYIYEESLKISSSCYFSHWYEESNDAKRIVQILMERTRRPLEVRSLNFFSLNFNTYQIIVKWSYSYFTFLLHNFQNQH